MKTRSDKWGWVTKLAIFFGLFLVFGALLGLLVGRFSTVESGEGAALQWWAVLPSVLAATAATWVVTVRIEGRSLATLGLPGGAKGAAAVGLGTMAGLVLMGGVLLVFVALGWVAWSSTPDSGSPLGAAVALLALLLPAAFAEELLFRGFPFQTLLARFGPAVAVLATAVAFGSLHGLNPGIEPLGLVNITLAGVLLGVAYLRTGSLWFATGVHLGWNWIMAVSELSVSGIEIDMPGFDPVLSGPGLWTGGAFGPEGGLTVTAITIAGTFWMWRVGGAGGSLSHPRTGVTTQDEERAFNEHDSSG